MRARMSPSAIPSLSFKVGAIFAGALVPPVVLLILVFVRKQRKAAQISAKVEAEADSLLVDERATEAGILPRGQPPVDPPSDCSSAGQNVSFILTDGATFNSVLDDAPADIPALRTMLARLGTIDTKCAMTASDIGIEYGLTADCWLTVTDVTPLFAVLRASHGLRVTLQSGASQPASSDPPAARSASPAAKKSQALQWLASVDKSLESNDQWLAREEG